MRKIKLFLLLGVILFNTFAFTSCNMNQSFNNIPNDSSSIINCDSSEEYSFDEEGIIDCVLRQDFYLDGVHYVMNLEKELSSDENYNLLGYYVNACDLEYWMSFDNNPLLVYAIEENNTLVHRTNENLKNRFELYFVDVPNAIGLKATRMFIYEKEN